MISNRRENLFTDRSARSSRLRNRPALLGAQKKKPFRDHRQIRPIVDGCDVAFRCLQTFSYNELQEIMNRVKAKSWRIFRFHQKTFFFLD